MANILIVTPRFPLPAHSGEKIRIYNIAKVLAEEHSVRLVSICESEQEMQAPLDDDVFDEDHRVLLPKWKSWLQAGLAVFSSRPIQVAYYASKECRECVRNQAADSDLVLAHLIRTAQFVSDLSKPMVVEMTDALSLTYERVQQQKQRNGLKEWVYMLERKRVREYELDTIRQFDLTTLVSPIDKEYLVQHGADPHPIRVFSNGVDTETFPFVGPGAEPAVAFVGNMRTAQNQDACTYFVSEILPLVRKRIPDMKLRIIGSTPPAVQRRFNRPDVDFRGRVPDIASAVEGVVAGVCPMRIGAGVQNKVLEYMSLGLPAVVSKLGGEGIDAQDGRDWLVRSDPHAFADAIVDLYESPKRREAIGRHARDFIQEHHSWSNRLKPMVNEIENLL